MRRLIVMFALAFPIVFYLLLLAILVVEYGHLPNYVTFYDWFANVRHIIASTKSVADMVPIILRRMADRNRIHQLRLWPRRRRVEPVDHSAQVRDPVAGGCADRPQCRVAARPARCRGTWSQQFVQAGRFGILTSVGALCAGVTNATVFSVVHCATPSWVGSLAVLGFDSYDVFALEPFGPPHLLLGLRRSPCRPG